MIKTFLSIVLFCLPSTYLFAFDQEKDILSSWGIKKNKNGDYIYQGYQPVLPAYWVSKPMPQNKNIDYSRLPRSFKPLVIYGQQRK